ncbi:MAG: ABC transporter ATP-binding protein [Gemmatimonadota bacterium]
MTKGFSDHAVLDGLDLRIGEGERVALLGLNGAGKTTLFRCLLGVTDFAGRATVAGLDVGAGGREVREKIGYVPQRPPHFHGRLSELVAFFSRLRGVDPARVARRLEALDLSLAEHGGKRVAALSGGMLQKTLLALALASEVPVLLLDEPTANLDPRARSEFVRALNAVSPDTTILLASHRLGEVQAVADRLVVLHDGRIVFDGDLGRLRSRARAGLILWIRPAALSRTALLRRLRDDGGVGSVLEAGSAVGVRADRATLIGLLSDVRELGLEIEEFWTELPSLEEMLGGLLGLRIEGAEPGMETRREAGA